MKGFVTLAVGNEKYYRLAENLLKSYKYKTSDPMPFAIVADRCNEVTQQFDKVVLLDKPTCSYMDKLEMLNHPPFDENIFIDADCLVYGNINQYWNHFPAKGVTCFGKSLPLTSHDGWFMIDDIGAYKNKISFIPQLHGGIIFFNDDDLTRYIYSLAVTISENYSQYRFKYFDEPADEPVLALSMAVNQSLPIELSIEEQQRAFLFYPTAEKIHMDIRKGLSYLNRKGEWIDNVLLLHWQNVNTETPKYRMEIRRLDKNHPECFMYIHLFLDYLYYYAQKSLFRILGGLKRRIRWKE